ncbi:MAG: PD-(D/E)XK nuclease family protein [Polyangiaceae bacterium]
MHAALAAVPLDADGDAIAQVIDVERRMVGASVEEATAARVAVEAALAHPLFGRARAASEVRRECAVQMVGENGVIVEGVLDLAFREGGRWVVVDYKTDAELDGPDPDAIARGVPAAEAPTRRAVYGAQLAVYVEAVARATGEPAEGILLSV